MEPVTVAINYGEIFQNVVTEALNGVSATLPVAVPILGVMAAINLGIKIFRKLTGRV